MSFNQDDESRERYLEVKDQLALLKKEVEELRQSPIFAVPNVTTRYLRNIVEKIIRRIGYIEKNYFR